MYIRLPTVAVHPYFGKASLRRTNHLSTKAIFRVFVYLYQGSLEGVFVSGWVVDCEYRHSWTGCPAHLQFDSKYFFSSILHVLCLLYLEPYELWQTCPLLFIYLPGLKPHIVLTLCLFPPTTYLWLLGSPSSVLVENTYLKRWKFNWSHITMNPYLISILMPNMIGKQGMRSG